MTVRTPGNHKKFGGAGSSSSIGDNYILNPSGMINQGGVGSQADVSYDFDQWLSLTQSNPVTVSQVQFVENGTPSMMRSSQANASAQRFGRIQWIESKDCTPLRAQAIVLSARVRMSVSTTLRYAILESTVSADAMSKDVVNDWTSAIFTGGNFWSAGLAVATMGSIALTANTLTDITPITVVVNGATNNLAVFFWTDSTQAQNVTLDVGKVKLERGIKPTAFIEPRVSDQMCDCQRYYCKSFDYAQAPAAGLGAGASGHAEAAVATGGGEPAVHIAFPVEMRVQPTVTLFNPRPGGTAGQWGSGSADSANARVIGQCTRSTNIDNAGTVLTAGEWFIGWTANARL